MRSFLFVAGVVTAFAGSVAGQILPPDCQCSYVSNSFTASHIYIGNATWSGSCSVTTISGQDTCTLAGTITFFYDPKNGFVPDTMNPPHWGQPFTVFTPPTPGTSVNFYPSDSSPCPTGTTYLRNYIDVLGQVSGGGSIELFGEAKWKCVSAQ